MTMYRYNHLRVMPITRENWADFPDYPCPWYVIVDDNRRVLADGPTAEAAQQDFPNSRPAATPSPAAERTLRQVRAERRRRRMNRLR